MKKLVLVLFVIGIALPSFAGLKPKNVVGTWTYELTVEGQSTSGTLTFEKDGKGLSGEVITEDGYTFPMTKVEIRDGDVLYFEMEDNYAPYKASMIIDGKAYAGTVNRNGVEVPVTGKKLE